MPKTVNHTKMQEFFQSPEGYQNRYEGYKVQTNQSLTFLGRIDKRAEPVNLPFENDITIYKESKLKMNHEGCSNSLSEECTAFHRSLSFGGKFLLFSNLTIPQRLWQ